MQGDFSLLMVAVQMLVVQQDGMHKLMIVLLY